jgi:hypothetical protein
LLSIDQIMHRLRFALSLLLPRSRAVNMPRTVSAFPSSTTSLAIPAFFPMIFRHGSSFSTTTSTNSTLPSFSEAQEVLNSQGSIRVRKALEVDGRSKMDAKEFLDLCRQPACCIKTF